MRVYSSRPVRQAFQGMAWIAMLLSVLPAPAGELMPARSANTAPAAAGPANAAAAAIQAQRREQALEAMARSKNALESMQAAQASARAVAATANNAGANPNQPTVTLPNVPNGLVTGGLVPDSGLASPGVSNPVTWTNAKAPVQTTNGNGVQVTVEQTASQALLRWQSFNIGKETTLTFDQSAGGTSQSQWIAFNKIEDPSGVPSQILGSIRAAGQVYVINQNGIIFGGASQVNTHALVASTLPINDNLISRGLLNNPDQQFLFSQLAIPAASQGTMPAFTPPAAPSTPTGRNGDVIVLPGARLESPTTPDHVGGRIALIGPNVRNGGTISTPDGQTILAAGNQVAFAAHASSDPSLRGLDVYVGAVDAFSGTATNTGLIDAPRANTTIAGKNVQQQGVISSSTSVSLNGRVDLLANYDAVPRIQGVSYGEVVYTGTSNFFATNSGVVDLGEGSIISIMPELSSAETVAGTELALRSKVNLQGRAIHLESGSEIYAPNAVANVQAGTWQPLGQSFTFTHNAGQIYLEAAARIDVSGTIDVSVPVSQNILTLQLRGAEFADSPLQRNGVFRGQEISIDIRASGNYYGWDWVGTPLADVSGYVGLIQRGIGQLTTEGGSVTIQAGESVVMQPGSMIDVSGGWINFGEGMVKTSKVAYQGHMIDISQATPNRLYQGFDLETYSASAKWGVIDSWGTSLMNQGTFQEAYVHGADGGSIAISAPAMALDGELKGQSVAGRRQGKEDSLPQAGALALSFVAQNPVNQLYLPYAPTPPAITFGAVSSASPADPFALDTAGNPVPLRADRRSDVLLPFSLLGDMAFGHLSIENSDGNIQVPSGVELETSAQGSISFKAKNIEIQGSLLAPGGELSLTAYNYSPYDFAQLKQVSGSVTPSPDPARGSLVLGSGAVLDASGGRVDLRADPYSPLLLDGGAVSLLGYDLVLEAGSRIDVSGGVALDSTGKITYGDAGSIVLQAGRDPGILSLLGGTLVLEGGLSGMAGKGADAGSLEILAPLVQIGGSALLNGGSAASTLWINRTDGAGNLLAPDFFSQGGFGSFSISGIGVAAAPDVYLPALIMAPDSSIVPVTQSLVVNRISPEEGINLSSMVLPESMRAPVVLSFGAVGAIDDFTGQLAVRGDLIMAEGASIQTIAHTGSSVTLKGGTVDVLGTVSAPGGQIALTGGTRFATLDPDPLFALPTVHLGPSSRLSASGQAVSTVDGRGFRTGTVLNGGSITVSGNIVAESGAVLDVRGSSALLDVLYDFTDQDPADPLSGSRMVSVRVDSNGGSITLKGSQELFTQATLLGSAGGPSAQAGSLVVSSGRFYRDADIQDPRDANLVVAQSLASLPDDYRPSGELGIGRVVRNANGDPILARGYFDADSFMEGGFGALTLGGVVHFTGSEPVSITASRSLTLGSRGSIVPGSGGVISADTTVNLAAPYVAIGLPFRGPLAPLDNVTPFVKEDAIGVVGPFYFAPTYGPGILNIEAESLVDVGILSLQNIGQLNITVRQGDVRGDGILDVAGEIRVTAGQIYPATGVSFTIGAYDYVEAGSARQGTITIGSTGVRSLPLSAGGELALFASVIHQAGTLRAPLGSIQLGWSPGDAAPVDLLTAAAFNASQEVALLPGSVTSISAIDPLTGESVVLPYGTILNGISWIDPAGQDITSTGLPEKSIRISGDSVEHQEGASIDIRGGGDVYAYRWVKGLGGTRDTLDSGSGFAVIPGYQANFAPLDPDYGNGGGLAVGDLVYLEGGSGLPAGTYTLLPARYALLPGAFLVTPQAGTPVQSVLKPDGASLVSGYRFNDLDAGRTKGALSSAFEIAPSSVVRQRSEYQDSLGNLFLKESALAAGNTSARLPVDSGKLVLSASSSMVLKGTVESQAAAGGRGSQIDISSSSDILIAGPNATVPSGVLVLDSAALGSFGAESLLVGGVRQTTAGGTQIKVNTSSLTVDNAGAALLGAEILLVSNRDLTVTAGSSITQSGSVSGSSEPLLLGDAAVAGSGDGVLLRVSGEPLGPVVRSGVSGSTLPSLAIGAGATISGAGITLDSTAGMALDPASVLQGGALAFGSGQITLELDNAGVLPPTTGLVLSRGILDSFQGVTHSLSLLSYSSIDIYGTGSLGVGAVPGSFLFDTLELHAASIRGFNQNGGVVDLNANRIVLDNSPGRASPAAVAGMDGSLVFNAERMELGANTLLVEGYSTVGLNASQNILLQGQGRFSASGSLGVTTPVLAGAEQSDHGLFAAGALTVAAGSASAPAGSIGGLGAKMVLQGSSVEVGSDLYLPSGILELHATTGDVTVSGKLDVSGTAKRFVDVTRYTSGGTVSLKADAGSVFLLSGSLVSVAAQPEAGDAGTLSIFTPGGSFALDGTIMGQGGVDGKDGTFLLDVGAMPGLAALNADLNAASFGEKREIRVRTGDVLVDGLAASHHFRLSADQGSITVSGTVDASGERGGSIGLLAHGSVILQSGSLLSVAADTFDAAGKGGEILLEAGAQTNGVFATAALGTGPQIDIQAGSTLDLSVAETASLGQFSGSLHLRAPQTTGNTDLQIRQIDGTILGASKIVVEGYQVYAPAGGAVNSVTAAVQTNGNLFAGNTAAMQNRLLANNASLAPFTVIAPGAEIINLSGDLTLASDWNLAGFRFGPEAAPGILTMRASGNLVFNGALSDGFSGGSSLWLAPLMAQNGQLPVNAQSWSYRLTAGADFSAADYQEVRSLSLLAANSGSLLLGKNAGGASGTGGSNTLTSTVINGFYQVIRTGTGDIEISAGRDVQLLNQFATIYTAGVAVNNPTGLFATGDFVMPILTNSPHPNQGALGAVQQTYPAQYSLAGGNVTLEAKQDIIHYTKNASGVLVDDSSRQMPTNWLYRRGYIDPVTGEFGSAGTSGSALTAINDPSASTTWWVDFSNFFEGVGALGGGNVALDAGRDVKNVDAVIPTNGRMAGGVPDPSKLVELGGGDLTVHAGRNIDGGVYYVERGDGDLHAGNQITTNQTRTPSLNTLRSFTSPVVLDSSTWLPTTLFLGKGSFDVSANGDVLIGPTANPFLLPSGLNNKFWYKTYFNTYDDESSVTISSLGGSVTMRNAATLPTTSSANPILQIWYEQQLLFSATNSNRASYYQPWLRLSETSVFPFSTLMTLAPPSLDVAALGGDINIVGSLNLFPSPTGSLELVAADSINGLQPTGKSNLLVSGQSTTAWKSARINLSDADPASIPGTASPFAYQTLVGKTPTANATQSGFLDFISDIFDESGSTTGTYGVLQTKQTLHDPDILHLNDPEPVRLFASTGDISGLTLYSAKEAEIIAGNDITDIAFYIQNTGTDDTTIVAAGGDIIAYNGSSLLRTAALSTGNALVFGDTTLAGDIQISGPGTLEVLAGGDLDLGIGPNNADGTGYGITSIGNARNPALPFGGADIIAGAGLGTSVAGLSGSGLGVEAFLAEFLGPASASASGYLAELGGLFDFSGTVGGLTFETIATLPEEEQAQIALALFYMVLRDAGRDYNDPASPNFGSYASGYAAVASLFPGAGTGDISLTSRQIKTKNGGDISLFAPGGMLTVGFDIAGNQAADQGILTEYGGNISIFTDGDVVVGTSRIFTLRGGDMTIWSSNGDIAAGASSKTVQAAPPTRVLVDPQSADVQTDLAGLATGGGIGVLASVAGIPPGNVDLIAPVGTIDAGDAGIRSTGNLNIAAAQVLNADNIQVGGANVGGAPPAPPPAPSISGLTSGANASGAANQAASETSRNASQEASEKPVELPSIITVEVLGYGGGEDEEDDDKEKARESAEGPQPASENPL